MRAIRGKEMLCGALAAVALAALPVAARADDEDAKKYVRFVEEHTGACTARDAVQVLVENSHPKRTLRVWLDRYHMGTGTGDRSRTDLAPGGPPEALGCSRTLSGPQEWRVVRAAFVD